MKITTTAKWLSLSFLIFVLDQLSKFLISYYLPLHASIAIIPGFNLTLIHNSGAAFGFLSQAGGWQRWFFIILTLVISGSIIVWMKNLPFNNRFLAAALALILGGAFGNLCDRILTDGGYVIDFIDVSLSFLPWQIFNPWPTFNVADSAITIGISMLMIDSIFFASEDTKGNT